MRRELATNPPAPLASPAPITAPPPLVLVPGAKPQHPGWFHVMAMIRGVDGIESHFLAEAHTEGEAVQLASRYAHRALVTNRSGKRVFDNLKPIPTATPSETGAAQ